LVDLLLVPAQCAVREQRLRAVERVRLGRRDAGQRAEADVHVDAVRDAQRAQVAPEHLPLGVALGEPAPVDRVVLARPVHRYREGQGDVPGRQQDAESTLAGFSRPAWICPDGSPPAVVSGTAVGHRASIRMWEAPKAATVREGDRGGLRRGGGTGQAPPRVGCDGRRTSLGHVGEQVLRLQDAQRLAYDSALDAELDGRLGLRGHAPTRPQHTTCDPASQFVDHLAV
jgi:hypothetical protein